MTGSLNSLRCLKCLSFNTYLNRHVSSSCLSKTRQKLCGPTAPPLEMRENDWIGPPDKVSNIRQMEFFVPNNETQIENHYRELRQALLDWHHEFWSTHNKRFFKGKEEFIKKILYEKGLSEDTENKLSAEEMSEYYKKFLDDNYKTHIQYNKEWYKKNISLLWPALQVNVIRLFACMRNKDKNKT